jgi:uncharacterized protein (DUF1778 family)
MTRANAPTPERRSVNIALRIKPSLRDALAAAAEIDGRPLASLVVRILEEWTKKSRQATK